jgi:hypothetical protein
MIVKRSLLRLCGTSPCRSGSLGAVAPNSSGNRHRKRVLTLRDRNDGKTLLVHQGQAVGESVDLVHRGESGDEPTVLLITYAGTPGVPTSIPSKGEKADFIPRKESTRGCNWQRRGLHYSRSEPLMDFIRGR